MKLREIDRNRAISRFHDFTFYRLNITRYFMVIFALLVPSSLCAESWFSLGKNNGIDTFVDLDSLNKNENGEIYVWVRYEPKTGKRLLLLGTRCESREQNVKSVVNYNSKGRVVLSESYPDEWEPIPPGTFGDYVRRKFCEK